MQSQEGRFSGIAVRSWLSFKTHPVRPLAGEWIRSGRGVEVVSEAEVAAVRALGCPTDQLLVNGVAKHTWLPRHSAPGLRMHFDSMQEVTSLLPLAAAQRWRVGVRCHVPQECDAREPRFGGQFGLTPQEVEAAAEQLQAAGVHINGMHFHLGQGVRPRGVYSQAMGCVVDLCLRLGLRPSYIDCGGGIGAGSDVDEAFEDLVAATDWARTQLPSLEELWLENGRYITRASAALVVRVLDVKVRDECRYLICDGGRTNHALDADHGPHHLCVRPIRHGRGTLTTIAGPTCMSDDRLARVVLPETVAPGDVIIWLDAGAYHLPWETRFSHGLCAVVWADRADSLSLARARELPDAYDYLWTNQ